jgi:CDGSH-type Zn-finger protein
LDNKKKVSAANNAEIRVMKNGPYMVSENIPLYPMTIKCSEKNIPSEWLIGERLQTLQKYLLCRCGRSARKPFCDGSHVRANFDGTETSDNVPFSKMAKELNGPTLKLKDAEILCASARFCHRGGDIWDIIYKTDEPWAKENVVRNSADCPSGRLVIVDKESGKTIEPSLEKSIGFIEDPVMGVDGPIWVRGGIPVFSADGKMYEARNRLTLCRCGKSTNKPFCDSSHYPEEDREI